MVFLDTNFLRGLFDQQDIQHGEANRLYEETDGEEVYIPAIIVAELLIGEKDGMKALKLCEEINRAFIPLTTKELHTIANFPMSLRKKLKAIDSALLALALTHRAALFTFDRKLKRAFEEIRG
jgi:predicted nucleic acid-binding protein